VWCRIETFDSWTTGRNKAKLIEAMNDTLMTMPGYSVGFSQPIIDMVMDQIAGAHLA